MMIIEKLSHTWKNNRHLVIISGLVIVLGVTGAYSVFNLRSTNQVVYTATAAEVNSKAQQLQTFFTVNKQNVPRETIDNDVSTELYNKKIIERYARENDITVSAEQVESYYDQRVATYDSEKKLLDELSAQYGVSKSDYLTQVEYDLLREQIQLSLGDTPLSQWLLNQRANSTFVIN